MAARAPENLLRDQVREAEVDRAFRMAQSPIDGREVDDDDEWLPGRHVIFCSPHRERRADGSLGPYFGPMTKGAWRRRVHEYEERARIALWDPEEAEKCGIAGTLRAQRRLRREVERSDGSRVLQYVKTHRTSSNEERVAYAYWKDGLSQNKIASRLALAMTSVVSIIRRLRQKANGGDAR